MPKINLESVSITPTALRLLTLALSLNPTTEADRRTTLAARVLAAFDGDYRADLATVESLIANLEPATVLPAVQAKLQQGKRDPPLPALPRPASPDKRRDLTLPVDRELKAALILLRGKQRVRDFVATRAADLGVSTSVLQLMTCGSLNSKRGRRWSAAKSQAVLAKIAGFPKVQPPLLELQSARVAATQYKTRRRNLRSNLAAADKASQAALERRAFDLATRLPVVNLRAATVTLGCAPAVARQIFQSLSSQGRVKPSSLDTWRVIQAPSATSSAG